MYMSEHWGIYVKSTHVQFYWTVDIQIHWPWNQTYFLLNILHDNMNLGQLFIRWYGLKYLLAKV